MGVAFAICVEGAALLYGHDPAQLRLIQRAEGGSIGLEMRNRDGSADLGPFQINDKAWVAHLARRLGRPSALVRAALKFDPCFNAYAAAYILRLAIEDSGGDVWEGMGRYHSATPELKAAYQRRLRALADSSPANAQRSDVEGRAHLQNERLAAAAGIGEDLVRGRRPQR